MNGTTNFLDDVKRGEQLEDLFIEWATLHNQDLKDVRKNKVYQKQGIDFIMKGKDKPPDTLVKDCITVDVKKATDNGNIIIEECNNHPKQDGWFYTSQAKTICYINAEKKTLTFMVLSTAMKAYYESIKERFDLKLNKVSKRGRKQWQSAFRLIPQKELQQFLVVKSLVDR